MYSEGLLFITVTTLPFNSNHIIFPTPQIFPSPIRYSGCCWVGEKLFKLKMLVDVTSKLPGAMNTSPVSLLFPLIRIQSGCGQGTIKIPGTLI